MTKPSSQKTTMVEWKLVTHGNVRLFHIRPHRREGFCDLFS